MKDRQEEALFEFTEMGLKRVNSMVIVSKNKHVQDATFNNIVEILDENGSSQVICTVDKFCEIFDEQGLSGFII